MASSDPEAKTSRPGWISFFWPGRWPGILSLKMVLPQKLCGSRLSQNLLTSVVHTLACADNFLGSSAAKMAPSDSEAKTSRAGWPLPILSQKS